MRFTRKAYWETDGLMRQVGESRYEIKMACDGPWLSEVRTWIRTHSSAFVEPYPPRQVNNIYFDTTGLGSFNDHLSGAYERRKLRFRWYGENLASARGALELKLKVGRSGHKVIWPVDGTLALASGDWLGIMRTLATRADAAFRELLGVSRPTLINHYRREYYVSADGQTRLTLDYAPVAYDQGLSCRPNLCFRVPLLDIVVIEVKSGVDAGQHLADVLAEMPLRVRRHSKYLAAMDAAQNW